MTNNLLGARARLVHEVMEGRVQALRIQAGAIDVPWPAP